MSREQNGPMTLRPLTERRRERVHRLGVAGTALALTLGVALLGAGSADADERCPAGRSCASEPGGPGGPAAGPADSGSLRHIPLQGAVNVRDLGGYATEDDRKVRHGLVYRADALNKLSDADLVAVSGLGLETVVDFRTTQEVEADGSDRLPDGLTPTYRPVGGDDLGETVKEAILSGDPVKQEEALGKGKAAEFMKEVYRSLVTDAGNRARFAETLREIAADGQGPLLYHCTSGKDRTGWTSYVLLRALGVSQDTAEQDYLASNTFRAEQDEKMREQLKESGLMENPDLLKPVQEVRSEYLGAALAQVEKDHGTLDGYLAEGLGLEEQVVERLKKKLIA
ncbi:tyrosine-protein phosphatase [Streptomyces sp. NPDC001594]|uniref:tyrosine-protein phosphatase n=1 Tax=Streptomyces sp. NPDC001594 TaxID=3364590 RepID=UPI00368B4E90